MARKLIHQNFSSKKQEYGGAVMLVTGIIGILLVAATVTLNALNYYERKSRLDNIVKSVAAYGGTFLPNPKLAVEESFNLWKILKIPIPISGSHPDIFYYFSSAGGDRIPYLARDSADLPFQADSIQYTPISLQNIKLPIKSMTVRIKDYVSLSLMNLVSVGGFEINVEATTQLLPTDIVLVIENSNSLISPTAEENSSQTLLDRDAFSGIPGWGKYTPAKLCKKCEDLPSKLPGTALCPDTCVRKSTRMTRQCFGRVAKNIKHGALTLYDLLSSSGTYRVGVVHNSTSNSEQAKVTVPLNLHPYERYNPSGGPENYSTNINFTLHGISVDPNETSNNDISEGYESREELQGISDFPSSRCAALTANSLYQIPNHPLNDITTAEYKSAVFGNLGSPPYVGNLLYSGPSQIPNDQLRFISKISGRFTTTTTTTTKPIILPRDAIWIENSGVVNDAGIPIPKYTYNTHSFGILRAIDLLYSAPQRPDGLSVSRKIILVLADGFEPGIIDASTLNLINPPQVTVSGSQSHILPLEPQTPTVFNNKNFLSNLCNNPDNMPAWPKNISPFYIDYATEVIPRDRNSSDTTIGGTTSVGTFESAKLPLDILNGFKLGILWYGFGGEAALTDPSNSTTIKDNFLTSLKFHDTVTALGDPSNPDLSSIKKQCTQKWAVPRGRFFTGVWKDNNTWDPPSTLNLNTPQGYWNTLAPLVARTLFHAELVD